jgi:hypothetical protein
MVSYRESKLIAIDEQANDKVMHLDRLGKTNGFTHQTLDARPQRQMLAFNLLRIAFPRDMGFGGQMPCVRPPMISEEAGDPKGLQKAFQFQEHLILAAAKDVGEDRTAPVVDGMPEPAWLPLAAHKAPHFINFGGLHSADADGHVVRAQCFYEWEIYGREGCPLFFNS